MPDDPTQDSTMPDTSSDNGSAASMSSADSGSAAAPTMAPVPSSGASSADSASPDPSSDANQDGSTSADASSPTASQTDTATAISQITALAAQSDIAAFRWADRGRAPAGYIKGMAVVYARVYLKLGAGDAAAAEMAKADTGDGSHDALSWFSDVFQNAGMDNSTGGTDTLRHLFVLLTGLGMRESSGKYCEGRDTSASNMTADTAEAGLFQPSFNARSANPLMPQLFQQYAGATDFVDIFKEGVSCSSANLANFGSGDGAEFQRLSKACPAFAAEFAAVGLRNIRKHWGPINMKKAEVRQECDDLFQQVQNCVDQLQITAI